MGAPTSDRGHHATTPWQMPKGAWKDIAKRTWTRTWQDNVGLVAAGVTYYGFLALVPLIGIVVLLYGLFAEPQTVVENVRLLTTALPPEAARFIAEQLIAAVTTSENINAIGIGAALLVALYGGANGAGAVMTAMNIAYEEKEKRSLLRFYGIALLITVIATVLTVLALVAATTLAFLGRLVPEADPVAIAAARVTGYVLVALAASAVAASLYRYAPSRHEARWTWITPGSLFAGGSWLLLTLLFSFYVTKVTDYSATYGSIGTVVVLLTWIYLSVYALMFGAELNSEIEHQTATDSTTGPPEPIGQRGAWAADNVADGDQPDRSDAPTMAEASPDAPTADESQRTAE